MTFEEWKEKHNDLIENVAITFFDYGKGVDTKTCYDELEYLAKKAFNAGAKFGYNKANEKYIERLGKAKVSLRSVIDYLGQFCSDYPDCVIEAEKILKEE